MPKNPKVTIGVILFKGEKYLKHSLRSLIDQDYSNTEYLVRDQSPNGEAFSYMEAEMPDVFKKAKVEKGGNLWHSGGHNALIKQMKGKYYFCCSNDMLYPEDFVSKIVHEMEKSENKKYGSATCKLMKWDFGEAERGNSEASKTDKIDSFGIGITKGHQFYDIGHGETDQTPYLKLKNIFGPSAALAIYRKEAIEDVSYVNENNEIKYFDELLHYKNDVDLAYRLQWAGYKSVFIPNVVVYHDRQVSKNGSAIISRIVSHGKKSAWARGNSLFGHLVTLKKNYSPDFSLSVKLKTALYRIIRYMHTTVLDAELLEQYEQVKKFNREITVKRNAIKHRVSAENIEKVMT